MMLETSQKQVANEHVYRNSYFRFLKRNSILEVKKKTMSLHKEC
jgi:hypothetical protein